MTDMKTPRIFLLLGFYPSMQVESFKFMKQCKYCTGGECVFTNNSFYGIRAKKQSDVTSF